MGLGLLELLLLSAGVLLVVAGALVVWGERAGLLKVDREWITVLPPGRMLVRVISMVFDRYLREGRQRASYSKVI